MIQHKGFLRTHLMGFVVLGVFFVLINPDSPSAMPIGPDCGSCQGGIYELTYSGSPLPDADLLHETFQILLTIDTSGLDIAGAVALDAAAIKVSSSVVASELVDAPGGIGKWHLVPGGI